MRAELKRRLFALTLSFALLISLSGCAAPGDLYDLGALLPEPGEADILSERDAAYTSKDDVSAYLQVVLQSEDPVVFQAGFDRYFGKNPVITVAMTDAQTASPLPCTATLTLTVDGSGYRVGADALAILP